MTPGETLVACPYCKGAGHIPTNYEPKFDRCFADDLVVGQLFEILGFDRIIDAWRRGKVEIKSDLARWAETGNIVVEYRCSGKPSGIWTTDAEFYVYQLTDGIDKVLAATFYPVQWLKGRCQALLDQRRAWPVRGGDGGRSEMLAVPLCEVAPLMPAARAYQRRRLLSTNEGGTNARHRPNRSLRP